MELQGIHHLTAISARIRDNHHFYTRTLGMRLVKRSVNQDDVSAYHLFYADAVGTQADGELRLNNVNGYGILLVKGNLQLAGNTNWNGIIIVTGVITSSGGGSNAKNIQGQIYSGNSTLGDSTISGSVVIGYNSCNVKKALSSQPLKLVSWKQSY